jgi:hypothetical protein
MKLLAIYDNGGKTFDRYTVYYNEIEKIVNGKKMYMCLGMSEHPCHPQGFGQHSTGMLGEHNGKRIILEQLPPDCQKLVKQELEC